MISKLKKKLRPSGQPYIIHDTKKDIHTITKQVNEVIDKMNEIIGTIYDWRGVSYERNKIRVLYAKL